jgi:hypothetical protein
MLAIVTRTFSWDFQLFGDLGNGSDILFSCNAGINGVYGVVDSPKFATYDEGNMSLRHSTSITSYYTINPGVTVTYNSALNVVVSAGLSPYLYYVATSTQVIGIIARLV